MDIIIKNYYQVDTDEIVKILNHILQNQTKIIMTQAEAKIQIDALTTQVEKVKTEIQAVKDALTAAQEAGQTITPELEASITNLGNSIQSADDLNPDQG